MCSYNCRWLPQWRKVPTLFIFKCQASLKGLAQSTRYIKSQYTAQTAMHTPALHHQVVKVVKLIAKKKSEKSVLRSLPESITAISDYLFQSSKEFQLGVCRKWVKATCTHTLVGTKGNISVFKRQFKDCWNDCCNVAERVKQTSLLASWCHFNYHVCWAQLQDGKYCGSSRGVRGEPGKRLGFNLLIICCDYDILHNHTQSYCWQSRDWASLVCVRVMRRQPVLSES